MKVQFHVKVRREQTQWVIEQEKFSLAILPFNQIPGL